MHQKKSEVQIGTESSGISSDFNPTPPLTPSSLTQKHPALSQNFRSTLRHEPPSNNSAATLQILIDNEKLQEENGPFNNIQQFSSFITNAWSLSNAFHRYGLFSAQILPSKFNLLYNKSQKFLAHFHHHLCRLRLHLRLILLFALPFLYFLVSQPSHSFILDFLSAFAFSATLLFSLNLAIPRLPTIRLFLARSLPIIIKGKNQVKGPHFPVFWSIGSRQNANKKAISGCFVQAYKNGDVYEGEFHEGQCSGSGVYYYYMSGRYEGDWVDGKYDGYGVETWARGSRYRGRYRQSLRHGFGVYRFYTGDVYAGEWSNGQSHGCGIHTCEDGSRYMGQFKWGVKHGLGHYHYRNGDTYAGEYFDDKMHGFGVYRFASGHIYEGAWHEGRRQGFGMYTFSNGETQSGHWQDGILDVPSTQNSSYPVSRVGVYHSKVLNAVQEARLAAEKAYDVTKVDERVNRAVSSAERAANAARVAAVKAMQKQMHYRRNRDEISISVL
ncbi:histone H3 K4-specific methyltransferase SET7/9 family protein [Abeliophyllum distichum]|uniref:Histone H3 K4-specific methyltransferase SET7/9 family protein n=1 Tax=Abeliophyllum distichum TaxID=126358 RepID=A0ABD1TFN4_9LAMI